MMQQLKGICKDCYGCNRLLNENFMGIYRCPNYMKGRKEDEKGYFKNNKK